MLLKELCAADGVSGCEDAVRAYLSAQLIGCKTQVDAMGNLLAEKPGTGPKILFAAHMDEVGLIISEADENGFLKFKTVGGIHTDVIIGKRVFIGEKRIAGIVGICAVHLQSPETRAAVMKEEDLYIDIGATSREEALEIVSLGDYAAFDAPYTEFGDRLATAKALDDRVGCAILLWLLQGRYNAHICCAFTAQEEVGTRGAQAAAEYFQPDMAIVVESTICADIFPTEPINHVTTLGAGPVVTFMDRIATPDRALRQSLILSAKLHKIPWQYKRSTMGGTDAGVISRAVEGVPTAILAIPCRNLHAPAGVICLNDYENTFALLDAWLKDGVTLPK